MDTSRREWKGTNPSHAERPHKVAPVKYTRRRWAESEKKLSDNRSRREALKKKGKRIAWKVPPLKYDRLVAHELVHVIQGSCKAPDWFREGMASWAGADPNYVMSFLYNNDAVKEVESPLEGDDLYGRSHLFMMWLEKKSGREVFKKWAKATLIRGGEVKASLEKLLGMTWEKVSA